MPPAGKKKKERSLITNQLNWENEIKKKKLPKEERQLLLQKQ